MNLELKEEYKKGSFGKATVAAGTEERWAGRANYNRFNDKSQLSFIGYGNNINQTGVNWEDYGEFKGNNSFSNYDNGDFGFNRGGGRMYYFSSDDSPVNNYDGKGLTENFGGGSNYNFDNKKVKVNASYFYNQTQLDYEQRSYQSTYIDEENSFAQYDTTLNSDFRSSHSLATRYEQEFDSSNKLIVKANLRIASSENDKFNNQLFSDYTLEPYNTLVLDNYKEALSYRITSAAIYRHLFKKKGRSFALSGGYNSNLNDGTENYSSINKFFEAVNRKLPVDGIFIGTVETKFLRKKRILRKYPPGINWGMYTLDFVVKRVFPKFTLTKKIYFFLTRGENRVITRAEVLGRLYSCGFEVVEEKFIGDLFYFAVRKIKDPAYDMNPTYGPFVKLIRVGKGGKMIKVYKLRTMHPYSEYLQDYIYKKNQLEEGGKFKDDFRVSTAGKIFRTFWLDELPMIINLFRGELKIFGVRPISQHYFNLYSKELQEKRIKYRPGLVPPFYADLPKTLEEIQSSEMHYLEAYEKHRWRTDIRYFFKAFNNIIFKRARSG